MPEAPRTKAKVARGPSELHTIPSSSKKEECLDIETCGEQSKSSGSEQHMPPTFNHTISSGSAGSRPPEEIPGKFRPVLNALDRDAALRLAQQFIDRSSVDGAVQDIDLSLGAPRFGSYHILFPILANGCPKWLIKIPSNGVPGKWTPESANALLSEAKTMAHLLDITSDSAGRRKLPIPHVLAFSATVANSLSCAYIAISYIDGFPLHAVWYGHLSNPAQFDAAGALARQTRTLECIVDIQAELGRYTYKQGGNLKFSPSPTVDGHTFLIDSPPTRVVGIGPGRLPDNEKMLQIAVQKDVDTDSEEAAAPDNEGEVSNGIAAGDDGNNQAPSSVVRHRIDSLSAHGCLSCLSSFLRCLIPKRVRKRVKKCFVSQSSASQPVPDKQPAVDNASSNARAGRASRVSSRHTHARRSASVSSKSSQNSIDVIYYTWGPLSETHAYITRPLDENPPTHPYQKGVHKLLRYLISWVPDMFDSGDESGLDRFVLAHPDLNMQNIIVDKDGTVVGLIDLDNIAAVPRVFGNETYPSFLTRDWDPTVYTWSPSMRESTHAPSSQSSRMQEDSPEELRYLRSLYLSLMDKKQEKESPFTRYYRQLCVQSVVVENIFLAAFDPMSRIQIMVKVISEAWVAYLNATGLDLRHISAYSLIEQINTGKVDEGLLTQLENAFYELLKAPDAQLQPLPTPPHITPAA